MDGSKDNPNAVKKTNTKDNLTHHSPEFKPPNCSSSNELGLQQVKDEKTGFVNAQLVTMPNGAKTLTKDEFSYLYAIKMKEFLEDETKNPYFELAKSQAALDTKRKEIMEATERYKTAYANMMKRQETFLYRNGHLSREVRNVDVNLKLGDGALTDIKANHVPHIPDRIIPQQVKDEKPGLVTMPGLPGNFKLAPPKNETTDK